MKIRAILSNLLSWLSCNHKATAVLRNALPAMKMADGSDYDPPPEVLKAIDLLMSLPLEEHLRAAVYMAPFAWHFAILEALNNPLAQNLFARTVRENYWRYHANAGVASPPSSKPFPRTGGTIQ